MSETNKTANEFCVVGRFWTTIPHREHSEEELEILRELLAMEAEELEVEAAQ